MNKLKHQDCPTSSDGHRSVVSELRSQLDALGAHLAGAEATAHGLKLERDALDAKLEEGDLAFNSQAVELENAVTVLEEVHPDCAMEYRYRTYPGMHNRPDGFVMPTIAALKAENSNFRESGLWPSTIIESTVHRMPDGRTARLAVVADWVIEQVKREVVEKIVKTIKEDGSPWSDADTAKLCEKSGIPPSTDTPIQEKK